MRRGRNRCHRTTDEHLLDRREGGITKKVRLNLVFG